MIRGEVHLIYLVRLEDKIQSSQSGQVLRSIFQVDIYAVSPRCSILLYLYPSQAYEQEPFCPRVLSPFYVIQSSWRCQSSRVLPAHALLSN